MSRRVIEELRRLPETHGFLRGLVAYVGFPQVALPYDRDARRSGKGHYNRHVGSLRIGVNGLICFSRLPLDVWLPIGGLLIGLSMIAAITLLIAKLAVAPEMSVAIPAIALLVTFLGGLNLVAVGILGAYVGRMYDDVKQRPQYIIDKAENVASLRADR